MTEQQFLFCSDKEVVGLKPSKIKTGKTYVGRSGLLRKVSDIQVGLDGNEIYEKVHFISLNGRNKHQKSMLTRIRFANWALGEAVEEVET